MPNEIRDVVLPQVGSLDGPNLEAPSRSWGCQEAISILPSPLQFPGVPGQAIVTIGGKCTVPRAVDASGQRGRQGVGVWFAKMAGSV